MRISRGNRLLGERSVGQVQKGIADASLFLTDSYYHEDTSEWLPLADFISRQSLPKPVKPVGRPCYCGSGLSFQACHGDGSRY